MQQPPLRGTRVNNNTKIHKLFKIGSKIFIHIFGTSLAMANFESSKLFQSKDRCQINFFSTREYESRKWHFQLANLNSHIFNSQLITCNLCDLVLVSSTIFKERNCTNTYCTLTLHAVLIDPSRRQR